MNWATAFCSAAGCPDKAHRDEPPTSGLPGLRVPSSCDGTSATPALQPAFCSEAQAPLPEVSMAHSPRANKASGVLSMLTWGIRPLRTQVAIIERCRMCSRSLTSSSGLPPSRPLLREANGWLLDEARFSWCTHTVWLDAYGQLSPAACSLTR